MRAGGAIASISSAGILLSGLLQGAGSSQENILTILPPTGFNFSSAPAVYGYRGLIANNSATLGGGVYVQDTRSNLIIGYGMMLYNNTANGGGAIYFDNCDVGVGWRAGSWCGDHGGNELLVAGKCGGW